MLRTALVIDVRTDPPTRGPWSVNALSELLGEKHRVPRSRTDPVAQIAPHNGRVLVLDTEKVPARGPARLGIGDNHVELAVFHIYHDMHNATPLHQAIAIAHSELRKKMADPESNAEGWRSLDVWAVGAAEAAGAAPANPTARSSIPAAMATESVISTEAVLDGLKDFQRKTVDWVFDRLYAPAPAVASSSPTRSASARRSSLAGSSPEPSNTCVARSSASTFSTSARTATSRARTSSA
jgi:hypothetical protein